MTRIVLLLAAMMATAAMVPPDKKWTALLLNLPAPTSEDAAQRAAAAFVAQQLNYPPGTTIQFKPPMRAILSPASATMQPEAAVYMCGTVRFASDADTAVWKVEFSWQDGSRIHDGLVRFGVDGRFIRKDCDEIYRDGVLVYRDGKKLTYRE